MDNKKVSVITRELTTAHHKHQKFEGFNLAFNWALNSPSCSSCVQPTGLLCLSHYMMTKVNLLDLFSMYLDTVMNCLSCKCNEMFDFSSTVPQRCQSGFKSGGCGSSHRNFGSQSKNISIFSKNILYFPGKKFRRPFLGR